MCTARQQGGLGGFLLNAYKEVVYKEVSYHKKHETSIEVLSYVSIIYRIYENTKN